MSELSKQALKVENNQEFPNNNSGFITPSRLRGFNEDIIDSTVNQTSYNTDSGSWNQQIDALENFTASLETAFVGTGSFNAYTASNNTKWNNLEPFTASITASVQQLLDLSSSLSGGFVTEGELEAATASLINSINTKLDSASFNTYTASNDQKVNSLINATSSYARYDVSNPWSADQNFTNITALSASFTYVQTTFETASTIYSSGSNQFGDAGDDIQTLYGSVRVINELTASGLNYPTADGLEYQTLLTDGNANLYFDYTKTLYKKIQNGEATPIVKGTPLYVSGAMGDLSIVYAADAGNPLRMPATLVAYDNSLAAGAEGTAVILGLIENVDTTGFPEGTEIYVGVGGGYTPTRPTGSTTPVQPLGIVTRTGTNGAGIVLTQVPFELPNIEEGHLWVGDSNNQAVAVATSSLVVNIDTGSLVTTQSFNEYTASNDAVVNALVSATASYADSASVALVDSNQQAQIDALIAFTGSVTPTVTGSLLVTASANLNVITFTKGDDTTFNITVDTGSGATTDISALNAFTQSQEILNAGFTTTASFNSYTQSNDAIVNALVGATGSYITDISELNAFTQSADSRLNNLEGATASYADSASVAAVDAAQDGRLNNLEAFTGSIDTNFVSEVEFGIYTSSNDSKVNALIAGTASYADSASVAAVDQSQQEQIDALIAGTGSYITDISALNAFTQSADSRLGNLESATASYVTETESGSFLITASVTLNTITFTKGDASTFALTVDTGSGGGGGASFPYSGSVEITGSIKVQPFTLSVASQTASIDMNESNYFILNLPTASTTHIAFTNIIPGESINLLVSQSAGVSTGSVAFAPNILFPNGFDYQATATGSAADIVSFVSFTTAQVFATQIKNLF